MKFFVHLVSCEFPLCYSNILLFHNFQTNLSQDVQYVLQEEVRPHEF